MGCGCQKNKNQPKSVDPNRGFVKASPAEIQEERIRAAAKGVQLSADGNVQIQQDVQPVQPTETKSPSLLKKALNLGEAVANHVADGFSKVSKEELATRLSICEKCPYKAGTTCSKCGCVLTVKAAWKTSTCPDDPPRWPEIKTE